MSARHSSTTLRAPSLSGALVAAGLIIGYVLLGLAGLQLQSSQTGLTPVWPASGLAFVIAYRYGLHQLVALLPAMLLLAWIVGVPFDAAALSAFGSMLEAGVSVYLMRRVGVDPRLGHLRDVLLFVGLGPVLGAAIGATIGTLAFQIIVGSSLDVTRTWLLWWLGNSVGLLIVGGFGLVALHRGSVRLRHRDLWKLAVAGLLVTTIMVLGLLQVTTITSPLVLFLLFPVFVLAAQRGDQYPVMLLGLSTLAVLLLSASWLTSAELAQTELGLLYLDVSLLWVVVFTGMITSSARREERAREQVSWLANHDPLTRLLNRHAFMERLERAVHPQHVEANASVLMYLDLDRFKDLNDAEGHRAGDQVLRDVAVLLVDEVRAGDQIARLGGDEFAVLLEDCALLDACSIGENIRSKIEHYEYAGEFAHHRIEVSIGLVALSGRHTTPEDVLHDADSACYEAKRAGRNRVWVGAAD